MSGGDTKGEPEVKSDMRPETKETLSGYEDVVEGLSEEDELDEEALKEKRGDEAGPETVLEKSQEGEK